MLRVMLKIKSLLTSADQCFCSQHSIHYFLETMILKMYMFFMIRIDFFGVPWPMFRVKQKQCFWLFLVHSSGGMPIGAVLMKQHVADVMKPGDHGSTFAGNPLVCAAGVATFDIINTPAFLADVSRKGELFRSSLRTALADNVHVKEVRTTNTCPSLHETSFGILQPCEQNSC